MSPNCAESAPKKHLERGSTAGARLPAARRSNRRVKKHLALTKRASYVRNGIQIRTKSKGGLPHGEKRGRVHRLFAGQGSRAPQILRRASGSRETARSLPAQTSFEFLRRGGKKAAAKVKTRGQR